MHKEEEEEEVVVNDKKEEEETATFPCCCFVNVFGYLCMTQTRGHVHYLVHEGMKNDYFLSSKRGACPGVGGGCGGLLVRGGWSDWRCSR
jgi:hypothetical protein